MPSLKKGGQSQLLTNAQFRAVEEGYAMLTHTISVRSLNRLKDVLVGSFENGEVSTSHIVEIAVLELCEKIEKRLNKGQRFPRREHEYVSRRGRPTKKQFQNLAKLVGRRDAEC